MDNAAYHADTTAISASGLKLFMRAPALYYAAYLDPDRIERQPTPQMMLGTATHCAILEPGEFDNRYVVIPEGIDRRTNEGKQLWADLLASGKQPLSDTDWQRIKRMSERFHADPDTVELFARPHVVESTHYATINGVYCKCRPDFLTTDGLTVMDVKTTSDASQEGFGRSAWNLGYHVQAAFYQRVLLAATGTAPSFVFGCVESDYPHLTAYYTLPDAALEYADALIDDALERYAECLASGVWPGYGAGTRELVLPGYAQRIIEQGDGEMEVAYV